MKLPIDFEEKVRLPAAVDGKGYPYRTSAKDLMANFVFSAVGVPENLPDPLSDLPNGIKMETVTGQGGHQQRNIYAEPFPDDPASGDIMYYDGTRWVVLSNPGTGFFVLTHNGEFPSWSETSECA